jgi:hypothetical protein
MFRLYILFLVLIVRRVFRCLIILELVSIVKTFFLVMVFSKTSIFFFLVFVVCEAVLGFSILVHLYKNYRGDSLIN